MTNDGANALESTDVPIEQVTVEIAPEVYQSAQKRFERAMRNGGSVGSIEDYVVDHINMEIELPD
jgi:hypothetical protein